MAYVPSLSVMLDTAAPRPSKVLYLTQDVRNIVFGITPGVGVTLFLIDQFIGIYS